MQAFRDLRVWQKSHALTLTIFRITDTFPKTEPFGLASTTRRWSANISMKIAEGCGRDSNTDFIKCLQQARGLSVELEYQLLLSRDLHFIEPAAYDLLQEQLIEVRKMLSGFIKTLQSSAL